MGPPSLAGGEGNELNVPVGDLVGETDRTRHPPGAVPPAENGNLSSRARAREFKRLSPDEVERVDLPQDRTVAFPQGIEERLDGGEDGVAVGVGGPGGWRGLRERWALGITGGGAATRKGQPREGSDSGESVHEFRSSLRVIER